jgi:DNA adenine methylase
MQHNARVETASSRVRVSRSAGDVRPFLKWAGGKRQLLPRLRRFYPAQFRTYFEPFVGSGAVFFDLFNLGLLEGHGAVLLDNNPDLVGCFLIVRERVETLIRRLKRLATERQEDAKRHYYDVRDRRFNPMREKIAGGNGAVADRYTPDLAAMLIYLNRTGFNGLFRLNARGLFNVPIGRYANPQICDAANLRRVARALSTSRAHVLQADFSHVLTGAKAGDFLYFDPPYAPLSATALFTSYTAGGFGEQEQVRLQRTVIALAARGCHVLLSNSTAPLIQRLYDANREAEKVGLRAYRIPAKRAINSDASARGQVLEYLITNVPERAGNREQ